MRAFLILLMMALSVQASPIVKELIDGDFACCWDTYVISNDNNLPIGVSTQAVGGNPDAFQQIRLGENTGLAGQTSSLFVVGQINNTFEWDPSFDGPFGSLDFEFDIRRISSTGFTGGALVSLFFRPLLRQGGELFRASTTIQQSQAPADGSWGSVNFALGKVEDWTRDGSAPDFSASGTPIQFGYEAAAFLTCSAPVGQSCTAFTIVNGVDNFSVRVASPDTSAIPEPGTMLLLTSGLLGLVALRRFRRA